eukprot:6492691-Amphidinium_carterae.4
MERTPYMPRPHAQIGTCRRTYIGLSSYNSSSSSPHQSMLNCAILIALCWIRRAGHPQKLAELSAIGQARYAKSALPFLLALIPGLSRRCHALLVCHLITLSPVTGNLAYTERLTCATTQELLYSAQQELIGSVGRTSFCSLVEHQLRIKHTHLTNCHVKETLFNRAVHLAAQTLLHP